MLLDVLRGKGLSYREAEVATEVVKGIGNKEVATKLFVTEKTIKFHLTNIYRKMGLKSRSQLIVWCMPHVTFTEQPGVAAVVPPVSRKIDIEEAPWNLPAGSPKTGNA